jgi:hypothetical protein
MSEANGQREHLEDRAAEVRSRLERRLDVIDERRHRVAEIARSVTRPPTSIVLLAAAGAAFTLFFLLRARRRRAPSFSQWFAPATPVQRERSALVQGLGKAAASLAVVAVQRLGKRGLDQLLAEPAAAAPSAVSFT